MQLSESDTQTSLSSQSAKGSTWPLLLTAVLAVVIGAGGMYAVQPWLGHIRRAASENTVKTIREQHSHRRDTHAADSATSLTLSPQAMKNVRLTLATVRKRVYERTVTMPAVVVDRPGKTKQQVVAPLSGVVTKIFAAPGEALKPGQKLFELHLMHEELVQSQTAFLRNAGAMDVTQKEIDRLKPASERGIVAGKTLLKLQYEMSKLQATQQAQRQLLLLHGLSTGDVDDILRNRKLKPGLSVTVPARPAVLGQQATATPLILQQLNIEQGQHVEAGERLCVFADYSKLLIEGMAFEQDVDHLHKVIQNGWTLSAIRQRHDNSDERITGLRILYLSGNVDTESRTLHFYVELPNRRVEMVGTADVPQRFIQWQFKLGQRISVEIPVARWPDSLVLPTDAVIREGAESYVFQQNGERFERLEVHELHRDRNWIVIADDGSLFEGDIVVISGAYQMQLALKNQSGGIDPHAGHSH